MLLSLQAGVFPDAGPEEARGPEQWRNHFTRGHIGPMNAERCLLLLAWSHRMARRGSNWLEQLHQSRASTEILGVMLEVVSHEENERELRAQDSIEGISRMDGQ